MYIYIYIYAYKSKFIYIYICVCIYIDLYLNYIIYHCSPWCRELPQLHIIYTKPLNESIGVVKQYTFRLIIASGIFT